VVSTLQEKSLALERMSMVVHFDGENGFTLVASESSAELSRTGKIGKDRVLPLNLFKGTRRVTALRVETLVNAASSINC
jgi:hypothetical protein